MLNPRQRPKSPPREAMKSTGPILMLRSSSLERLFIKKEYRYLLTHDSVLAKEDVDNSNILLPSIVVLILGGHSHLSLLDQLPSSLLQVGRPCVSFSMGLASLRCRRELSCLTLTLSRSCSPKKCNR